MARTLNTEFISRYLPKTRKGYIRTALVAVVALFIIKAFMGSNGTTDTATTVLPIVQVASVDELESGSMFSTTGTVEAVSEAQLKAESGGRIVRVNTDLGKYVAAGTVIAQLENSRESAALVQAQGSYDAAVAGAAQGNSSVRDAEIRVDTAEAALETTLKNSVNTISSVLTSTVDQFFADPTNVYVPGLRVSGNASVLNKERVDFQTLMPKLSADMRAYKPANPGRTPFDVSAAATKLLAMVTLLKEPVLEDGDDEELNGVELSTYGPGLYAAEATLNGIVAAIEGAEREVATAKEAQTRATVSGTDATVSLANAQIKIALGSLRAAQANYEKTLVRTSIAGVVNALYVKPGDFVSPLQDIAVIANNNGLQVTAAIAEADRDFITIGDTVAFDGTATGTITAIAGAVDPKTGKIAIKMSVTDATLLTTGSTVGVQFDQITPAVGVEETISIPLTAVKLLATSALIFTVNGDDILESKEVTLGRVLGDRVIVTEGLDLTTKFVLDARGRKAGEKVTISE